MPESVATQPLAASETRLPVVATAPETAPVDVEAAPVQAVKMKAAKPEVRARITFADSLTGKNFKPGDIVTDWNDERVAHYAARGLVVVQNAVGPTEFK